MNNMSKKYNILISANHCAPGQGSEHGVGWNFVSRLAKYHNITLITNQHAYFNELSEAASELGIKVYAIKQHIKFKGWVKLIPFIYYSEYRWWQYRVYKKAGQLHKECKFDLMHQITNITFREPGYLWKLKIPFVWGPVVALGHDKPKFLKMYGFAEGLKMILRHISFRIQYAFPGRIKKALKASSLCLPVCEDTLQILKKLSPGSNFHIMPETAAIDENITDTPNKRDYYAFKIYLLWASRLDPSKGIMLLLQAISRTLSYNMRYELLIAGDGPQKKEMIDFCRRNYIDYRYFGQVSYDKMQELYSTAHLFFITSMMDATTSILYEAMSKGLPIIALEHLSFGEKVDDSFGRKIKVKSVEQITHDIALAIIQYRQDEEMRYKAAENAIKQARENSWNTRIERLNTLYNNILNPEA